ncbi:MAG: RNA methyltransferase [Clostridia bacterium]|nr:RNA methyltransferase [Clostridia bacterium]
MIIETTRNEAVKRARQLSQRKGRQEQGVHFIEGEKLVREAIISGAEFENAFIEEGHELMEAVLAGSGANVYTVKRHVMESMTNTTTPQWVCATVKTPSTQPPAVYPSGMLIALDRVQEPGNLGTIIRSADAMGARGVLIGDGSADAFAPKPVRASMGSIYHVQIWNVDLRRELYRLRDEGYSLICGHLGGSEVLPETGANCVLVVGNESQGVSDDIAGMCELYRLPMYGFAESLNASVAASLMMYDIAKRMRAGER